MTKNRKRLSLIGITLAWCILQSCTDKTAGVPNLIPSSDELTCKRDPTAYLVGENVVGSPSECIASAKIQAIAYECGNPEDTLMFTTAALKENTAKAQIKCDQFCKRLSQSCVGVMTTPGSCGLISPPRISLEFGKNVMRCPKKCKGQAFNYCSIYQGNFLSADPSLFKDVKENCSCRKR